MVGNQLFRFHIQYLCYLEEDFETGLSAIANIRVYYAETLAKSLSKPSLFYSALFEHLFYAIFGLIHIVCFYFLQKKSIAKSIIIAVIETPRLASSSLIEDFTTDDIKLVAKCNILLTGLSSGLLFSIASMP